MDSKSRRFIRFNSRFVVAALAGTVLLVHCAPAAHARIAFTEDIEIEVAVGERPHQQSIAIADISIDPYRSQDLLVVNADERLVEVFLSDDGEGLFESPDAEFELPDEDGIPIAIAVGNFDGSGSRLVDLAVLTRDPDRIRVFRNTPDPDDPDNDFFEPEFDFTIVDPPLSVEGEPRTLIVGRFNNDTRDDLAVLTANQIYIFLSNGDGTFVRRDPVATTGNDGFQLVAAKLNDDEFDDIAVTDPSDRQIKVFTSNSTGVLTFVTSINAGDEPRGITAADYDLDGNCDLIVADAAADVVAVLRYFPGLGRGELDSPHEVTASEFPYGLITFDVDRNGALDVVATSVSPQIERPSLLCQPSEFCNTLGISEPALEANVFRQPRSDTIPFLGFPQVAVIAGDVTGDLLPDLIFLSEDGETATVVINESRDGSTTPTPTPTQRQDITPPPTRSPTPTRTPLPNALTIGSATGRPGDVVEISVWLEPGVSAPLAVQNEIRFDARVLWLQPASDCFVNPAIGKELRSGYALLGAPDPEVREAANAPVREVRDAALEGFEIYVPVFLSSIRLSVVTGTSADPIPPGLLYTCRVQISATARPGTYVLSAGVTSVVDAISRESTFVRASSGEVLVSLVSAPSTPTPSLILDDRSSGGCAIGKHPDDPSALLLLAALALLLRRRKEPSAS